MTMSNTKTISIPYSPHKGQKPIHSSRARIRVVAAGRKFGKTTLCTMEAFNYLGKPNAMVWWVAPFQDVANIGWRRFLLMIPPILIKETNKREHTITMINNATLIFKTADNPNALVGEGIDLLILDEAARIPEKVWYETLRPNLDDPDRFGHAILISTPRSMNWFYELWALGRGKDPSYASWFYPYENLPGGFPSWVNPRFDTRTLEDVKRGPERIFLQEYAARFVLDTGAVFRNILQAKQGSLEPPIPGEEYYAGVDWGKAASFTVVTILNSKGHLVAYDRFRKTSWTYQVKRVAELLKSYDAFAYTDSSGIGDPVFDMLFKEYDRIQGIKITAANKADLIENLALLIEQKAITYPEIPDLIDELSAFGIDESTTVTKYHAPKGYHDDFVMSLALAAWHFRSITSEASYSFITL